MFEGVSSGFGAHLLGRVSCNDGVESEVDRPKVDSRLILLICEMTYGSTSYQHYDETLASKMHAMLVCLNLVIYIYMTITRRQRLFY
jgi:hypothetical protein